MPGRLDAVFISLLEKLWRGCWCRRNSWKTEVTRDQINGWVTDNDGELRRESSPEEVGMVYDPAQ